MDALIRIESRPQHSIDPKLFGHFIEELGNCIYDGIWSYSQHLQQLPMLIEDPSPGQLTKVRRDLFNAMSDLVTPDNNRQQGASILRWPGGCFSDVYHWKNGIGARETRPITKNDHWNSLLFRLLPKKEGEFGPIIPNQFGTDEFCTLCEKLGVEPYININYGTGTPEEAADWVEYVNGDRHSYWGAQRAQIHPEPYAVKYFGIANEIFGKWEVGHPKCVEDYGLRYLEFAKAMKMKDPKIRLVAVGLDPYAAIGFMLVESGKGWNRRLLPIIKDYVDYLSCHLYLPGTGIIRNALSTSSSFAFNEQAYWSILASPQHYERTIDGVWADLESCYGSQTHVRIALDEWGLWYYLSQVIKANYCLMDGLWTACVLNLLQRKANVVSIANWAQMVNCIGAIRTDDAGLVKTPVALAFESFWKYGQSEYLPTNVECGQFRCKKFHHIPSLDSPFLDVSASQSKDGKQISLSIVNKHYSEPINISFTSDLFNLGKFSLYKRVKMTHQDPFIMNEPQNRNAVQLTIENTELPMIPERKSMISIPAHSFEMLLFRQK